MISVFSGRVIGLHSVGSEASCYRFHGFSNLGKELVGRVSDDGDCEVIKEKQGLVVWWRLLEAVCERCAVAHETCQASGRGRRIFSQRS